MQIINQLISLDGLELYREYLLRSGEVYRIDMPDTLVIKEDFTHIIKDRAGSEHVIHGNDWLNICCQYAVDDKSDDSVRLHDCRWLLVDKKNPLSEKKDYLFYYSTEIHGIMTFDYMANGITSFNADDCGNDVLFGDEGRVYFIRHLLWDILITK